MNERIKELWENSDEIQTRYPEQGSPIYASAELLEKFAELIVEDCRTVISETYRKTALELCGPLLTADEEIAKHFYGVEE